MSDTPVWMQVAVRRLVHLESAISVHRELIESGEMPRKSVDQALWNIYDSWNGGCNGACCG